MLNSGKHFLTSLLNRVIKREGKNGKFFARNNRDRFKARNLTMEPLEDRQLLTVNPTEISAIASTYSDFGITRADNFIDIVNTKLTQEELESAILRASRTTENDVIVLRTTSDNYTINMNAPLTLDINSQVCGSVTIIGYGTDPLRLNSTTGTVIAANSGNIQLGNLELIGRQTEDVTEDKTLSVGYSAKVAEQDVTHTVQTYWTQTLPNGGDATILKSNGIYTVDFSTDGTSTLRSYVTGLTSLEQVNDLVGSVYTESENAYGDSLLYYTHEDYVDADITNTINVDQHLGWAGVSADMLTVTGWGKAIASSEDDVYEYYTQNWSDNKYYVQGGLEWFMNGTVSEYGPTKGAVYNDKDEVVTAASNDVWASVTSDGGNLFGSQYMFSKYGGSFYSSNYYRTNLRSPLVAVAQMLDSGKSVSVNLNSYKTITTLVESVTLVSGSETTRSITSNTETTDYEYATGAITIYGYVYDTGKTVGAVDYFVSVYATDPLDDATGATAPNKLEKYDITWRTTGSGFMIYSYELAACGHSVDSETSTVYGTPTTTDGRTTQVNTVTTVTTEVTARMGSFVYLSMAEGYSPVEQDPYEPNESADQVDTYPTTSETVPTPNLGIIEGTYSVPDLNLADEDGEDWYKFTTNVPCSSADYVAVEYTTTLFSGDLQIYLYTRDANGKLVYLTDYTYTKTQISSINEDGTGENRYKVAINMAGIETGTYYVQVLRKDPDLDCKNYTLTIATASDDRYEINNTRQDVDTASEGAVNSPNLGPIMVPELVLSDLILKQASPSWKQSSEVDAFRFVMTGVGGPNSYIEIQYQETNKSLSPNDADLDLFLYSQATDDYYQTYPTAFGNLVAQSTDNVVAGVERVSLEGLQPGVYYIKVAGYINSQNLLNYKVIIHLRDDVDEPGIGVTADPDYYVSTPSDWQGPMIVTSQEYATYDPEAVGNKTFSNESTFISQDKIHVNLSFSASSNSPDNQDVSVGIYVNGILMDQTQYDSSFTVDAGGNIQLTDEILAELTNEIKLTLDNNVLWTAQGENWSDGFTFKEGMVLSLLNSDGFIDRGYVYTNGMFVSISPVEDGIIANGTQLTVDVNGENVALTYYNVNVMVDGKKQTTLFTDPTDLRFFAGTAVEFTIYTQSGQETVYYNASKNTFRNSTQTSTYNVPNGSVLSGVDQETGETVYLRYENGSFYVSYFNLDEYKTTDVSATAFTVNPLRTLTTADGSVYYYRGFSGAAASFYTKASVPAGSEVTFTQNGQSVNVLYEGIYQGVDKENLYPYITLGQGKFLIQYNYNSATDTLYYKGIQVQYDATTNKFTNAATGKVMNIGDNSILSTSATGGTNILYRNAGLYKSWMYEQSAMVHAGTTFVDTVSGTKYTYADGVFTNLKTGVEETVAVGAILFDYDNGDYYRYTGGTSFNMMINTIPNGSVTVGSDTYQYEDGYFYTNVTDIADNTEFVYDKESVAETTLVYRGGNFYEKTMTNSFVTVPMTGGDATYIWKDGYFFDCQTLSTFVNGSEFVFYENSNDGGFAASYLKLTPPTANAATAAFYMNKVSFTVDPNDEIKEYLESNNTSGVQFTMYRYQDDKFIPNSTKELVDKSTNTDIYVSGQTSTDDDAHYNPNLGPVAQTYVVDNLVMLTGEDWFSFELLNTGDEDNYVRLDFSSALGDLDLYVYQVDAEYPTGYRLWGSSATVSDIETVSLNGASDGKYYIRVVGFRGANNPYYKMTVVGTDPIDASDVVLTTEATPVNSSSLITWEKEGAAADYIFGGAEEYFLYTDVKVWAEGHEDEAITYRAGRWDTQLTVNNLLPDTHYHYSVTAFNSLSATQTALGEFFTDDFLNDTKYYGLIIGVSEYRYYDSLDFARTDATGVYNALAEAQPQWTAKDTVIVNSDGTTTTIKSSNLTLMTGAVTQFQIENALKNIGSVARENDVVFVYYVGLGTTKQVAGNTESYLMTYDNTTDLVDAMDSTKFSTMVKSYLNVGQLQVVLNPYFVNSSTANQVSYDYTGFATDLINAYDGVQTNVSVITSANNGENGRTDEQGNDVFGKNLINSLTEKIDVNGTEYYVSDLNGNQDGRVSFEEIFDYVESGVKNVTDDYQHPQLFPQDEFEDSIVIKGDWLEINENTGYNYFKDEWWNAESIIVTTNVDVVDRTDGLVSLREAIDYLGTVLTDDTRLTDGSEITIGGNSVLFNYDTAPADGILPGSAFTMNDKEYTYREGLYYTTGTTNPAVILADNVSFTWNGTLYTYKLENGVNKVYDEAGVEVPDFFADRLLTFSVQLANGSTVVLRQTGIKTETMVLDTITFANKLSGTTLEVTKTLEINDADTKYTDNNGNEQTLPSITIDATSLSGTFTVTGANQYQIFNVTTTDLAVPVAMKGLKLTEGRITGDGSAIANTGNLWLLNMLIYDNVSTGKAAVANTGTMTIVNSTISGNLGVDAGGVYNAAAGTLRVYNSILYANMADGADSDLINEGGTLEVLNSLVGAGIDVKALSPTNLDKTDIADVSVLFIDAENNNYHIVDNAEVINAGDYNLARDQNGDLLIYDLDGVSRRIYGGVDMGAFEWIDPSLKLGTTVTTLFEDNNIDDVISLREAISYVGTTYSTEDTMADLEGGTYTIDGTTVYVEKGVFVTHQTGFFVTLNAGSVIELAVGDTLFVPTSGATYTFTGTGFTKDLASAPLVPEVNATVQYTPVSTGITAWGKYNNYTSVPFTDYENGDVLTYADHSTGTIRIVNNTVSVRRDVTLGSVIAFDIDKIKADFIARGNTEADWNTMLATTGLVFSLDNVDYEGAISVYSDLSIDISTSNVFGSGADRTSVINNGITISPTAGSDQRIFNIQATPDNTITFGNLKLIGLGTDGIDNGGAVSVEAGNLILKKVTVQNNKAENGGAFYVYNGATLTVTDSTLSGNETTQSGGAVYLANGAELTVTGSVLSDNIALGDGGALYAEPDAVVTLETGTEFLNNTAVNGGAIYSAGTVTMTGTNSLPIIFAGNSATNNGGAVYNLGTLTATRIMTSDSDSATPETTGNKAKNGGFLYNAAGARATFNESKLYYNVANQGNGGAVYNLGAVLFDRTDLAGNRATLVSNSNGNGSAIYDVAASVESTPNGNGYSTTLVNSLVRGNGGTTSSNGAGIYAAAGAKLNLIYTTVTGNASANANSLVSGIYLDGSAELNLTSSVVAKNAIGQQIGNKRDIESNGSSTVNVTRSFVGYGDPTSWNVDGPQSQIGTDAILDPEFTKMTGATTDWTTWDLTPAANSPLINAAWNVSSYNNLAGKKVNINYDFSGRNRFIDDTTQNINEKKSDMGAYEAGTQTEQPSTIVTTEKDIVDELDGLISLREAIEYASAAESYGLDNVVTFDPGVFGGNDKTILLNYTGGGTIGGDSLNPGSLVINSDLVIDAGGMTITVSGDNKITPFKIMSGADIEIKGLNITGGYAKNTTVGTQTSYGRGGAFEVSGGVLKLTECKIYDNKADDIGGGIYQKGGTIVIANSLIYDNEACVAVLPGHLNTGGGAIRSEAGRLVITETTIAKNTAPTYGGIYATDTILRLYDSILAKNSDRVDDNGDLSAKNLSDVYNCLIGLMDDGDLLNLRNGNVVGTSTRIVDPKFVDANANDFHLADGSPAINTADSAYAKYPDGTLIIKDIDGSERTGLYDMGAYESENKDPMSTVVTTLLDEEKDDGLISITEAIRNAQTLGTPITFNIEDLGTQTITLKNGVLNIVQNMNIVIDARINGFDGSVIEGGITFNAAGNSGVFSVENANLTLYNLNITGGAAGTTYADMNGAAISQTGTGTVTLTNCVVYNNKTTDSRGRGGAIYVNGGKLTLLNTTVAGNVTHTDGAIYAAGISSVTIKNSIVCDNLNNVEGTSYNYDIQSTGTLSVITSLVGALSTTARANAISSIVGTEESPATADFTQAPVFRNEALTNATNVNFRLLVTSDAINSGTNTFVGQPGYVSDLPEEYREDNSAVISKDIDGNERIMYYIVDMGAYEYADTLTIETPSTIVTTNSDVVNRTDGLISLREAINYAGTSYIDENDNSVTLGNIVTFDPSLIGTTITLDETLGELVVNKEIVVSASSLLGGMIVDAGSNSRAMTVSAADKDVVFEYFTFINGNAGENGGGAILHTAGNLTLINSLLYNNRSAKGGAIYSTATTGTGNQTDGTLKLVNCTVTRNNASLRAEGASGGYGGIYSLRSTVTLYNTIVALNTYGYDFEDPECEYIYSDLMKYGYFTVDNQIKNDDFHFSLIGIAPSWSDWQGDENGNVAGTAAKPLDPVFNDWDNNIFVLDRYVDDSKGYENYVNSPAINAGNNSLALDANGASLSIDLAGNERFIETVDMGVFESAYGASEIPSTVVTTDQDIVNNKDGLISLREAIMYAGNYGLGSTVTFLKSLSGTKFSLNEQLVIDKNVTIDGASLGTNITLSIRNDVENNTLTDRIIYVNNGTVKLIALTLTNDVTQRIKEGQTISIDKGGAVYVRAGSLFLYNSLVYDCQATSGGALFVENGDKVTLSILNSTITDNRADDAAVVGGQGRINLQNSILARNMIKGKSSVTAGNQDYQDIIGLNVIPKNCFIQNSDSISSIYGTGKYGNYIGNQTVSLTNEAKNYLFTDWDNDNFSLKNDSLAVNSGLNHYTVYNSEDKVIFYGMLNDSEVDLLGNKRLVGTTIDMGAYENQINIDDYYWISDDSVAVTTNFDVVDSTDGLVSLREAVSRVERLYDVGIIKPVTFSKYHLGDSPVMVLDIQSITISRPMTIDASVINSFAIDANHANNIFRINVDSAKYDSPVTLENMILYNGSSPIGGAINHVAGDLILLNSLIHSNAAEYKSSSSTSSSFGGGIYSTGSSLTLVNCTVANNSANRGGGIYITSGQLNLYNTILAKNILTSNATTTITSTTDVDLVKTAGVTTDIRYTLIGNAYSFYSLNGVDNNQVGYGDDKSIDPYFIDINNGNFRLLPSVDGKANPALQAGNVEFITQYSFNKDLDGNLIGSGEEQVFALTALGYFDDYMESKNLKPVDPDADYPDADWYDFEDYLQKSIQDGRYSRTIRDDMEACVSPQSLLDLYDNQLVNYDNSYSVMWFLKKYLDNISPTELNVISKDERIDWAQQYTYSSYISEVIGTHSLENAADFAEWLSKVNAATAESKLVNQLLEKDDFILTLYGKLWTEIYSGEEKAILREMVAPDGVLIASTIPELEGYLDTWDQEATLASQLYSTYTTNPCDNIKAKTYASGSIFQSQLFRAALLDYLNAPIDLGAYQTTKENFLTDGQIIVTTLSDVVDAYDGLISLREAINYATNTLYGNNRYYYYEATTGTYSVVGYSGVDGGYKNSVSTNSMYSDSRLLVNRCPIVFADSLAGGTITLDSDLYLTGYANFDDTFKFCSYTTSSVWYYYIDATSLSAKGGITIDASNCEYAFNIMGAKHPTLDLVTVTYAEFEGLKITGAQIAGIYVDPYSIAEVRNSLLYRNRIGIMVDDVGDAYYGVAHIYNTTIANNTRYGIMQYGKIFVYNSILSLNDANDIYVYPLNASGATPPPAYRTLTLNNSLYGQASVYSPYFYVAGRNNMYIIDAKFVDEANDDYHLSGYSLGINTGNGDYLAMNRPTHATAQTDLDGKDRTQCGQVDMGAYENTYVYDIPSTVVTTLDDVVDPTDGEISIREAISFAEQYQYTITALFTPNITNTVTFAPDLNGETITLVNGVINLVNDITINGSALASGITISGNDASGVFRIDIANTKYGNDIKNSKVNVKLIGMNLTGGYAVDGGAVYIASGNVLIQDCDIYGNEATGHGGAIYIYRDELTLTGVNIGGNKASHYGGVASNQGVVLLNDTYIAENKATVSGADYDFYFETVSNVNGYGSKDSVLGKTRGIILTGHGPAPAGDTNWIASKDGAVCDNFEIDSVFEGEWNNDVWEGTLRRTFVAPTAAASALPEIFAELTEDDELFSVL